MNKRSVVVSIFLVLLFTVSLACSRAPVFSQAEIDKVREYNMAGDIDKTIMAAKEYLEANPGDPEVLTILGENYGKNKDFLLAEKSLKQAILIQPENAWAIRAFATIYRIQAQEAESSHSRASYLRTAVAKIEEGLNIFPNDAWVNREAAEIYLEIGDKARAKEYIAKTLMIEPADAYSQSLEKEILAMP